MSSTSTPPEGYFNDLTQRTGNAGANKGDMSPGDNGAPESTRDSGVPKPKRIACIICRKRKLKCDGSKPSCSTCTRLGHNCAYDEFRRKSGPKRGYVKALEERLSKSLRSSNCAPFNPRALVNSHESKPPWNDR